MSKSDAMSNYTGTRGNTKFIALGQSEVGAIDPISNLVTSGELLQLKFLVSTGKFVSPTLGYHEN